jgi:predicted ATPase/serine/threonine protein kinase
MKLEPGTRLGDYEVVSPLGTGGMGEVYRAKDLKLGRDVAIKILRHEFSSDRERLSRFEREARSASALNHPNIITIYAIGEWESIPYMVMEFLDGRTLRELLSSGPLPTRQMLHIAQQVADGLAKAHEAGIVHRDLKPENLIVTGDGFLKILDFGLAKLVPASAEHSESATLDGYGTASGVILGTVGYMSPEQACGRTVDFRCDQFSFGAILYEMATGAKAFLQQSPIQTLSAIIEKHPEPIASLNAGLPPDFVAIVERLLAKDPVKRFDSTRTLAAYLQRLPVDDFDSPRARRFHDLLEPPNEASPDQRTQACPQCGEENPGGLRFCGRCGSALGSSCPSCGKEIQVESSFCAHCGHRLTPSEAVQPPIATPREHAAKTPSGPLAEGERRQVTILFSNLSGYTAMVERLDPGDVERAMDRIKGLANQIVEEHGGVVNQVVRDEITALFGIPISHEDDLVRAARAASELHRRVRELSAEFRGSIGQELRMHSGINTGRVVAQQLDSKDEKYRIAGDAVQVAARLVAEAEADEILVSAETRRLIAPFFETEAGEPFAIKGKTEPLTPYRVLRESGFQSRLEAAEKWGLTKFTGRETEFSTLAEQLDKALEGEGQFVTVLGEAGVGKSRLLYEFRRSMRAKPIRILLGRCQSYGSSVPYLPFIDALRVALHVTEADSASQLLGNTIESIRTIDPRLESYIPLYLHLLSIQSDEHPIPDHLQGAELRLAVLEALSAFFTVSAENGALAIFMEDWQWADEASQEALVHLLGMVSPYPLLVAATYRPDASFDWGDLAYHTRIHLRPLESASVSAIVKSILGAESLPKGLEELIRARTAGNPFFVEEICHTLLEDGTVQLVDGRVIMKRDVGSLDLPDTVQVVIRTRLDRLDGETQETLRNASVIGREFNRRTLEHTLPDQSRVSKSLEALKALGLIRQIRVLPEATYEFHNTLTQEVAYESLLLHQRKALHQAVGEALEELFPDRPEEQADRLAYHFSRAVNWEKAVHYGRLSAERSAKLSQFAEGLRALEDTEDWVRKLPEGPMRQDTLIDVLLRKERACETLGAREQQQSIIDELLSLLESAGDRQRFAEVLVRQGELHARLGRSQEAEQSLESSLAIAKELSDPIGERNASRSMGFLRWSQGNYEEAAAYNDRALEIDRELGDTENVALDLTNLGAVLRSAGDHEQSVSHLEEAIEIYDAVDNPVRKAYAVAIIAASYRDRRDTDTALDYFQQAADINAKHGVIVQETFVFGAMANIRWEQGQTEESLQIYRDLVEKTRRAQYAEGLAQVLRRLSELLRALGKADEALPYLLESTTVLPKLGDRENEAVAWSRVAEIYEKQAKLEDALKAWEKARKIRKQLGDDRGELESLEGTARVARLREETSPDALLYLQQALKLAEATGDRAKQGNLLNTLGILEWKRRNYEEALSYYEQSLSVFQSLEDRVHIGLILNSVGVTLKDLGRHQEALDRLEEALEVNRETGQRLLEGHTEATMGEAYAAIGDQEKAMKRYETSLEIRREIGDRKGEGWMLYHLARLNSSQGANEEAREQMAEAGSIATELDDLDLRKACDEVRK